MPCLSPFQHLPLHVAECIVCYCISTRLESRGGLEEQEREKHIWATMYNVSHSWQLLATQYFFKELVVNISGEDGTGRLSFNCLPKHIALNTPHYGYVKRVEIKSLDYSTSSYSESLHDFASAWPETLVLPLARHLFVDLSIIQYQVFDKTSTTKNERFYWLSRRIQTSMPRLQEVTINDEDMMSAPDNGDIAGKWKADVFLSTVFGKAAIFNIQTYFVHINSNLSFVQSGTGLTTMDCSFLDKNDVFGFLVEKSATTLESLRYYDLCLENMRSFVIDSKDRPIVYPRLRRLDFFNDGSYMADNIIRLDKFINPFPVLRYLAWRSMYMFEDDTLFRGNSSTLEYLDIEVDAGLAEILQKHKVFSSGKYSQLSHVSVHYSRPNPNMPMDADEFSRLAIGMTSPATKYFSLSRHCFSMIFDKCSTSLHLANIQILCLDGFRGGLPELLEIVTFFPNMTRLTCSPGAIDFESDSVQFSEFIDSVYAESYPLSNSLRHWEVLPVFSGEKRHILQTALAFSILSAGFVLAVIPSAFREDFRQQINNAIESGLYDRHIDKMQRLLRAID